MDAIIQNMVLDVRNPVERTVCIVSPAITVQNVYSEIMVYIVQVNVMITVSTVRQSLSVKFVNLDFTVTGVIIIVIHDV